MSLAVPGAEEGFRNLSLGEGQQEGIEPGALVKQTTDASTVSKPAVEKPKPRFLDLPANFLFATLWHFLQNCTRPVPMLGPWKP